MLAISFFQPPPKAQYLRGGPYFRWWNVSFASGSALFLTTVVQYNICITDDVATNHLSMLCSINPERESQDSSALQPHGSSHLAFASHILLHKCTSWRANIARGSGCRRWCADKESCVVLILLAALWNARSQLRSWSSGDSGASLKSHALGHCCYCLFLRSFWVLLYWKQAQFRI